MDQSCNYYATSAAAAEDDLNHIKVEPLLSGENRAEDNNTNAISSDQGVTDGNIPFPDVSSCHDYATKVDNNSSSSNSNIHPKQKRQSSTYTAPNFKRMRFDPLVLKRRSFGCDACNYGTDNDAFMDNHLRSKAHALAVAAAAVRDMEKDMEKKVEVLKPYTSTNNTNTNTNNTTANTDTSIIRCELCDIVVEDNYKLFMHKSIVHEGVPGFQCELCEYQDFNKAGLDSHVAKVHPSANTSSNNTNINNTINTKTDVNTIHTNTDVNTSTNNTNASSTSTNSTNASSTSTNSTNINNTNANTKKVTFKCSECGFTCNSKDQMLSHIASIHTAAVATAETNISTNIFNTNNFNTTKTRYKCKECSYTSDSLTGVQSHAHYIHSKQKDTAVEEELETGKAKRKRKPAAVFITTTGAASSSINISVSNSNISVSNNTNNTAKISYMCKACSFTSLSMTEVQTHAYKSHPQQQQSNLVEVKMGDKVGGKEKAAVAATATSNNNSNNNSNKSNNNKTKIILHKCKYCNYTSTSMAHVRSHSFWLHSKIRNLNNKKFICGDCRFVTDSDAEWIKHGMSPGHKDKAMEVMGAEKKVVVVAAENTEEKEDMEDIMTNDNSALEYLKTRNCIRKTPHVCPRCPRSMTLVKDGSARGKVWRCRKDGVKISPLQGSFFAGATLSLSTLMQLMHYWAKQEKLSTICTSMCLGQPTVVQWNNRFRSVCSHWLAATNYQIGGPGIAVRLDSTLLAAKEKKRVLGKRVAGRQSRVLGGFCADTGLCFLAYVGDTVPTADTIERLVVQHVAPGSIVYAVNSDGFEGVPALPVEPAYQLVPMANNNNRNSNNNNNFDAVWQKCKKRLDAMRGTTSISSHLDEFMWRELHGKDENGDYCSKVAMENLLLHISQWFSTP